MGILVDILTKRDDTSLRELGMVPLKRLHV